MALFRHQLSASPMQVSLPFSYLCRAERTRRAPFARTYSRRGTTATHERWKERAQCDGAALGRSAWPGHRHNRARLLTTTDVATVHFIQPFIRFFAMGKRQQRFSIEFLQPFSLVRQGGHAPGLTHVSATARLAKRRMIGHISPDRLINFID
jgi:hypothetical protein